ncbi:hypothetical protein FRB96_006642, partial [Tulasnella sp. 330]
MATGASVHPAQRKTGRIAIGTGNLASMGEVSVTPEGNIAMTRPDEAEALPLGVARPKKGGGLELRIRQEATHLRHPIMLPGRMTVSIALSPRQCNIITFILYDASNKHGIPSGN